MGDQLKYIVQELNKPAFNMGFSLITFDILQGRQLLKILNKVFAALDTKEIPDIDEESREQTATCFFNLLRVFKYKPAMDEEEMVLEGLTEGKKSVIHPILEWLLSNITEHKKRAYLARFLLKLDVPQDQLADIEVNDVYQQYVGLMEQFKEVHKQCEQLRLVSMSALEVKRDISNMEDEKKQLTKRIERMKKKIENFPNVENMLAVARSLRQEHEREDSIKQQKHEQRAAVQYAEQKLQRLNQHMHDMRQSQADVTPEGIIQRCQQDVQVNSYIVKEKLPKEIKARRQLVADLDKVVRRTDISKADLDELYGRIQTIQNEISRMVEKRMLANEPMDDKLSMFRQQAAIIGRKKESTAETINELRADLNALEEQCKDKGDQLKQLGGVEILKGDEFKQYVTKLRGKSNTYKKKRQEQSEIRAEIGVLTRTEEILKQKHEQVERSLAALEEEHGVSGYRTTQDELEKLSGLKSVVDDEKGQTLSDMSVTVSKLNREIQSKKSTLSPLIKELRPLRQQCQEMSSIYEDKKAAYNSMTAGIEANASKLEREVKGLEIDYTSEESKGQMLKYQIEIMNAQLEQANAELKSYLSADPNAKKQSMREQLTHNIQEQEKLSKKLKEEQKVVRDGHQDNLEQMQMWTDLKRLLECKQQVAQRRTTSSAGSRNTTHSGNLQTTIIQ